MFHNSFFIKIWTYFMIFGALTNVWYLVLPWFVVIMTCNNWSNRSIAFLLYNWEGGVSVGKTLLKEGVVPKRLKTCYFTKPSLCKEYVTLKACCCESETLRLITFVTFYQDRISLNIFFSFLLWCWKGCNLQYFNNGFCVSLYTQPVFDPYQYPRKHYYFQ